MIITREAADLIRRNTMHPPSDFDAAFRPMPDGTVDITLDPWLLDRINALAFSGESVSDTLVRLFTLRDRGLQ